MARREALLKITKSLINRRAELRKRLGLELEGLGVKSMVASGDSADVAFESVGEELAGQLAELESKELAQVEYALKRIKQGQYGVCAGCGTKIPVLRLNALPYSTLCIKCQRESESDSTWLNDRVAHGDWDKVNDNSAEDRDINISDLEIDYSK